MAFPSTLWSEVRAAGAGGEPLGRLLERYMPAVYAYLRASGRDAEAARDLTQGFFTELLEHDFFARAREEHGRFRGYLMGALRNFLADEHDRAAAQKRGGGARRLDFDLVESRLGVAGDPSRAYDREWAFEALEHAMAQLRVETIYPAFRAAMGAAPYAQIARERGMSEQDVANHVHRARARLHELILARLRDTVGAADDLDEEVADLLKAIS